MTEQLVKLIDFAMQQQLKGNCVFVEYAGHVNDIRLRCLRGKWNSETNTKGIEFCLEPQGITMEDIDNFIDAAIKYLTRP